MKHTGDYELDRINMLEQECADLEEENKTLKEKLSEITMVADDEKQSIEHILELEEENKTLKDNVEFLHSCLDDRDKSIAIMQEEISSLRIELEQEKGKTGKKWTPSTPYI